MPLSLAKLFTTVPSAGSSGAMLLAFGLARRGVPAEAVTAVPLAALASYHGAYLIVALTALRFRWLRHL